MGANLLDLFHLLSSCDYVSFFSSFLFFPTDQQDKSNCLAVKKRMKEVPLWTEASLELPYTGWCSEISMKQHQRKQRDSSVLYKGPCELSKCLRSHYWQHFFALPSLHMVTFWLPLESGCRFPLQWNGTNRVKYKKESLRRQAVHHLHN